MANINPRLFNYGAPGGEGGWESRARFNSNEAAEYITEKTKAGENPRVSIPSPFARFQLMEDAFKACSQDVRKTKIDERDEMLVSQCLDVLELIYEGVPSHFSIERINLSATFTHLKELGDGNGQLGIKLLGETLETYAKIESHNLINLGNLYALVDGENVLALTCPTSIILPSPNYKFWESKLQINGTTSIFAKKRELFEREQSFILYLYSLYFTIKSRNNGIPRPLVNFGAYLTKQLNKIQDKNRDIYDSITKVIERDAENIYESTYENLDINGYGISIYGVDLKQRGGSAVSSSIEGESDLIIDSKINPHSRPLVLSVTIQPTDLKYSSPTVFWDSDNPQFSYDDRQLAETPVESRVLPNKTPYSYGFLYEHDFLSDYIFRLPYKLNSETKGFFDGNIVDCPDDCGFVPPIKMKYFEYFTVDDLKKNMKIKVIANKGEVIQVMVTLDVPIKSERRDFKKVTFRKTYSFASSDEEINFTDPKSAINFASGKIVDLSAALAIFPFVRFDSENLNNYAIQFARDPFNLADFKFNLNFKRFNSNSKSQESVEAVKKVIRHKETGIATVTNYWIGRSSFDLITMQICGKDDSEVQNELLLIPDFGENYYGVSDRGLLFSFDMGTSNTYVAVRSVNEKNYMEFTLPIDLLVSTISKQSSGQDYDPTRAFLIYIQQELFPEDRQNHFPMATVLATPKEIEKDVASDDDALQTPFLVSFIPFIYGFGDYGKTYNDIKSELKWAFEKKNKESRKSKPTDTKAFINELMFIAQAFAVNYGAKLEDCSVVWTYPLSMSRSSIRDIQSVWENAYSRYFKTEEHDENDSSEKIKKISESIAPVLYNMDKGEGVGEVTSLSVDIGGGTCDIVLIPEGDIDKLKLSSIAFGADAIFGIETWASNISMIKNAVVKLCTVLETTKTDDNLKAKYLEIKKTFDSLLKEEKECAEVTGALFNLERNKSLKDIINQISYNNWLKKTPRYHDIFQYYYAALVYYLANLCKYEDCVDDEAPEKIFYSGSGSKMLNIIGSSNWISDFTTALFKTFVKENDESEDISIKMFGEESKQITAKGAIPFKERQKSLRNKLSSFKEGKAVEESYKTKFRLTQFPSDTKLTYGSLVDDEIIAAVTETMLDFHTQLSAFVRNQGEDEFDINSEDMNNDFIGKSEKELKRAVKKALRGLNKDGEPEKEYNGEPFFVVVKHLIRKTLNPDD